MPTVEPARLEANWVRIETTAKELGVS